MELRTYVGTLLFAMPVCFVLVWGGGLLGLDPDWLLHVVYGRAVMAAHGPWLVGDPTIFTEPERFSPVLHEWGAEVLFALLGAKGSLAFASLVVGGLVAGAYRRIEPYVGHLMGLVVSLATFLGVATSMTVRPHLWSFVGVAALLALIEAHERGWVPGSRAIALALGLSAVWCNLHGGVLLGLPLIAVLAATRGAVGVGMLGAWCVGMCCNPWGTGLWEHVLTFLRSDAPTVANDFQPSLKAFAIWAAVVISLVASVARARTPVPALRAAWRPIALLAALALMGLTAHRNVVWLALVGAWSLPNLLPEPTERPTGPAVRWWPGLAALAAWLVLAPTPTVHGGAVPEAAAAWLAEHPELATARGYAGYSDGGYLVGMGVIGETYLHGLTANEPLELSTQYLNVLGPGGQGWSELLDEHGVRWVLLRPWDPLRDDVEASNAFEKVFDGGPGGALFVRQ
ncbi:MAG: hypothetical protein H6735_12200 [Alphaproteobacteria bacterium]|nr:hypothetical protein [Alphaproteobacteria bacterium]